MSFRRTSNKHDWCTHLVHASADLLEDLPRDALASEAAFRDYVTHGVHRDVPFCPSVTELSPESLDKLWSFIHHRAQFDMDASLFESFNGAYRNRPTRDRRDR